MENTASVEVKELPKDYYDFEQYITKERMITYWYQLKELVDMHAKTVLEVGKGSGIVAHSALAFGIKSETVDVNPNLLPDHCLSVLDLASEFKSHHFDTVLCARVLHHIDFQDFERALAAIATVGYRAIITLPVDDLRIYFQVRLTSRRSKLVSVPLPLFFKKQILRVYGQHKNYYHKLWKVNSSSQTSQKAVRSKIAKYFKINKEYSIPEDRSHILYVLTSLT